MYLLVEIMAREISRRNGDQSKISCKKNWCARAECTTENAIFPSSSQIYYVLFVLRQICENMYNNENLSVKCVFYYRIYLLLTTITSW